MQVHAFLSNTMNLLSAMKSVSLYLQSCHVLVSPQDEEDDIHCQCCGVLGVWEGDFLESGVGF